MAKYLDETGLAHFWGNVKSRIGYIDMAARLRNIEFAPYTRYIWENESTLNVDSSQVSTLSNDERYWFVIMPTTTTDNATDLDSWLYVIDAQTGVLVTRVLLPLGHGRSLSIKDGKMLTASKYAISGNTWVVVNVENPTNPFVESTGTLDCAHLFWTDGGAAYYDHTTSRIVFLDVTYSSGLVSGFAENGVSISVPRGVVGEEQSFYYWNGLIVCASTRPEKITFIDASSGDVVSTNELQTSYGFLRTAECEAAFVVNDHLYFSNNAVIGQTPAGVQVREVSLFRCDIYNQMGQWYDYWRDSSYRGASGTTVCVSGDTSYNGYSSVSFDGSSTYPYPLVEDALVSYTAKCRIDFSPASENLGIIFTGTTYPYSVKIHNTSFVVGLNGDSTDKTQIDGIHISDARGVILNRINIGKGLFSNVSATSRRGIVAKNSNVRVLDTSAFGSDVTTYDYDLDCESNSWAAVGCAMKRVYAKDSMIITSGTYTTASVTNSEIMRTAQSFFSGDAQTVQFGASGTSYWIRSVRSDNSAYQLLFTNSGMYFRHFPDYTNTANFTTIGSYTWNS